jgi:hypothetical protein
VKIVHNLQSTSHSRHQWLLLRTIYIFDTPPSLQLPLSTRYLSNVITYLLESSQNKASLSESFDYFVSFETKKPDPIIRRVVEIESELKTNDQSDIMTGDPGRATKD